MPDLTPNLGLKKPLGNETVSRAAYNENLDLMDSNAAKVDHAHDLATEEKDGFMSKTDKKTLSSKVSFSKGESLPANLPTAFTLFRRSSDSTLWYYDPNEGGSLGGIYSPLDEAITAVGSCGKYIYIHKGWSDGSLGICSIEPTGLKIKKEFSIPGTYFSYNNGFIAAVTSGTQWAVDLYQAMGGDLVKIDAHPNISSSVGRAVLKDNFMVTGDWSHGTYTDDMVTLWKKEGNKLTKLDELAVPANRIDMDDFGEFIVVSNPSKLVLLKNNNGSLMTSDEYSSSSGRVSMSPSGKYIAVVTGAGSLSLFGNANGSLSLLDRKTMPTSSTIRDVKISPNEEYLVVFVSTIPDPLFIYRINGGQLTLECQCGGDFITQSGSSSTSDVLHFSQDGRFLILGFATSVDGVEHNAIEAVSLPHWKRVQ